LPTDGTIIIKIFLHISKKEQKKRLLSRENDPLVSWMITKGDWDFHKEYEAYYPVIDTILKKTSTPYAPWTIVGATDPQYTLLSCYTTVVKDHRSGREKDP